MSLRRRCGHLRTRNSLVFMVLMVLFVGVILTYRTLSSTDVHLPPHSSHPSMINRKVVRLQAAQPRNEDFAGMEAKHKVFWKMGSVIADSRVQEVLTFLHPVEWSTAKDPDEVAVWLNDKMVELNLSSHMTCHDIDDLQIAGNVGSSGKKFVETLRYPEIAVAYNIYKSWWSQDGQKQPAAMVVKSQATDQQTKIACMKKIYDADFCSPMGNYLLLREVFFFTLLHHPSIANILGYCLRGDQISLTLRKKGVILVMEAGVPISANLIAGMTWSRKIKLALDAALLLEYLETSPLGNLGIPHVQQKDFIVVDHKSLKLADLDELELNERRCNTESDCYLRGSDLGVSCHQGQCLGLNHLTNLQVIGQFVIDPLLRDAPPQDQSKVAEMLNRIALLTVSSFDLLVFLEDLAKDYKLREDANSNVIANQPEQKYKWNRQALHPDDADKFRKWAEKEESNLGSNRVEAIKTIEENLRSDEYQRVNEANFPGQHDYTCKNSRVLWGCVLTFSSLSEAMSTCSVDSVCKAFVVLSSHPESASKMTVVFKSKGSDIPHVNLGTTLFIKKSANPVEEPRNANQSKGDTRNNEQQSILNKGEVDYIENQKGQAQADDKIKELKRCIKRNLLNQEEALRSREKRLMAHMGLKGMLEMDWKRAVQTQSVANFSNIRPLSGSASRGGTMQLHYNKFGTGRNLTRVKFMAENGRKQSHAAFALVYNIDRILGLYHTPPAVQGFLTPDLVQKFSRNDVWYKAFHSLIDQGGLLRGLFVAPTPRVVNRAKLTLTPVPQMVLKISPFDRTQKMQLEYVLLWWLSAISKPADVHHGFKGWRCEGYYIQGAAITVVYTCPFGLIVKT